MTGFGRIVDLRNNTTADILIADLGITVPANANATTTNMYRISDFIPAAQMDFSIDLETEVQAGNILVNGENGNGDGTASTNLSISQSLDEISITTVDSPRQDFIGIDEGGLSFNVIGGNVNIGGTLHTVSNSPQTLTDDATNYVFIDRDGIIQVSTTSFAEDSVPLYEVTTSGGDITGSTDWRTWIVPSPGPGAGTGGLQAIYYCENRMGSDQYLPIGDANNASSGVLMPVGITIRYITAVWPDARTFDINLRKNGNTTNLYTVNAVATTQVTDLTVDQVFNAGDFVQVYCSNIGPSVNDLVVTLWFQLDTLP